MIQTHRYSDELSMLRHVRKANCQYDTDVEADDAIYTGSAFNVPDKTCAIIWWR